MKKILISVVSAAFLIQGSAAHAALLTCGLGPLTSNCALPVGGAPVSGKALETRIFAGLQWNFGDSQPELVLGVRRSETSASGQVKGGKIDLAIPLKAEIDQIKPVLRLIGHAGARDVQGEFGFGLRAIEWKPLIALGAQAPYVNFGANYVFGDGLKPYAGFNTLRRAVAPQRSGGQLTCSTGTLTPVANIIYPVDGSVQVDGKTCYVPPVG